MSSRTWQKSLAPRSTSRQLVVSLHMTGGSGCVGAGARGDRAAGVGGADVGKVRGLGLGPQLHCISEALLVTIGI